MVNWSELAVFVTSVSASVAVIIYATQKSKCSHIECCYISCERNVTDENKNDLECQLERITIDEQPADRNTTNGVPIRPNISTGV